MANVIDSLVVELGLDASKFTSAMGKVSGLASSMATRLTGIFLGIQGIDALIGKFEELHKKFAELGYESRNLGVSATSLYRWGKVAEWVGGSASDAADSIQGFQSDIFNLKFGGQMSDSLRFMQQWGIAYLDANGKMLSLGERAEQVNKRINELKAGGMLEPGEEMQFALHAGLSGGLAAAFSKSPRELAEAIKNAGKETKGVTERMIDGQIALDHSMQRLNSSVDRDLLGALSKATPALINLTGMIQKWIDALPKVVAKSEGWISKTLKATGQWFEGIWAGIVDFFKHPPEWFAAIENVGSSLWDAIKSFSSMVWSLGEVIIQPIRQVIAFMGSWLQAVFPSFGQYLSNWLVGESNETVKDLGALSGMFKGIAEDLTQFAAGTSNTSGASASGTAVGKWDARTFLPPPATPNLPYRFFNSQNGNGSGNGGGNSFIVRGDLNINSPADSLERLIPDVRSQALRSQISSNVDQGGN